MVIVVAQIVCSETQWSTAIRKLLIKFILTIRNHCWSCLTACLIEDLTLLIKRLALFDERSPISLGAFKMTGSLWKHVKLSVSMLSTVFEIVGKVTLTSCWCSCFWRRSALVAKNASLVSEYLHIGSHTSNRLKFMTIAAARDKHSPTCCGIKIEPSARVD